MISLFPNIAIPFRLHAFAFIFLMFHFIVSCYLQRTKIVAFKFQIWVGNDDAVFGRQVRQRSWDQEVVQLNLEYLSFSSQKEKSAVNRLHADRHFAAKVAHHEVVQIAFEVMAINFFVIAICACCHDRSDNQLSWMQNC